MLQWLSHNILFNFCEVPDFILVSLDSFQN